MKKKFITSIALAAVLSSCGVTKNAEQANKNSDCIIKMNEKLSQLMTASGAQKTRKEMSELTGLSIGDMGDRLTNMAIYQKAQDFQTASNIACATTNPEIEAQYLNAAKEFNRKMGDVARLALSHPISMGNIMKDEVDGIPADVLEAQKTFVAYAATMHEINDYQNTIEKEAKKLSKYRYIKNGSTHANLSMMDLLANTLEAEGKLEREEISLDDLKSHQREIGDSNNIRIIRELFNARFNFLTALAVEMMIDVKNPEIQKLMRKIGATAVKAAKDKNPALLAGLTIPTRLKQINKLSRAKIIKYLKNAIKAKSKLVSLGLEDSVNLEGMLNLSLTFAEINIDASTISGTSISAANIQQNNEIDSLRKELLGIKKVKKSDDDKKADEPKEDKDKKDSDVEGDKADAEAIVKSLSEKKLTLTVEGMESEEGIIVEVELNEDGSLILKTEKDGEEVELLATTYSISNENQLEVAGIGTSNALDAKGEVAIIAEADVLLASADESIKLTIKQDSKIIIKATEKEVVNNSQTNQNTYNAQDNTAEMIKRHFESFINCINGECSFNSPVRIHSLQAQNLFLGLGYGQGTAMFSEAAIDKNGSFKIIVKSDSAQGIIVRELFSSKWSVEGKQFVIEGFGKSIITPPMYTNQNTIVIVLEKDVELQANDQKMVLPEGTQILLSKIFE